MALTRYRNSRAAPGAVSSPIPNLAIVANMCSSQTVHRGRSQRSCAICVWDFRESALVVQGPALGLEPPDQGGDLAGGKAPVAAQRLHVGKFLLRRPPRHRLGRYVKQRSNLLRKEIIVLVRLDHSGPPLPDNGQDPHVPGDRSEYTRWAGACAAISRKKTRKKAAGGARRLPAAAA